VWSPPPPQPDDWPQNVVLIAAIFIATIGQAGISPERWAQCGAAWGLALAWLYLRRRSLMGSKPWLAPWLVPVALGTAGFLNDAIGGEAGGFFILGVIVLTAGFCLIRGPRAFCSAILYVLAAVFAYVGVMFVFLSTLSLCGLFDGGQWSIMGLQGGWDWPQNLIAGGAGVVMVGASAALWQLAGRLRSKRAS
jgi:hypothetical protein